MPPYQISHLQRSAVLSSLDVEFAHLLGRLSKQSDEAFLLAAALASRWVQDGHVCLELPALAGKALPLEEVPPGCCPDLEAWLAVLRKHPCVCEPGDGSLRPLLLDRQRLYLYRYWDYEQRLVKDLRQRASATLPECELEQASLRQRLQALFPDMPTHPQQEQAILTALRRPLSIISGGPGTGKTTTVVKILALLLEQAAQPLRIALLAPTGKAAARLQQSVRQACPQGSLEAQLPTTAFTLHRWLGVIPHSPYFRRNARHPVPVDVVVLDEASMVDLALMTKLVEAIPATARLILLGDKDQLTSVEAGAVLGDIWRGAEQSGHAALRATLALLETSHRFAEDSGIARLARCVNQGDSAGAQSLLIAHRTAGKDLYWQETTQVDALRDWVVAQYRAYLRYREPQAALDAFARCRVLCARRSGPHGVSGLNQQIEHWLRGAGLLHTEGRWYAGRPVMITENDYQLELFNGDIGLLLPDAQGRLRAYFPANRAGLSPRGFLPTRLPGHDTAYAMTIHKSQGSEFEHLALILPPEPGPLLSRELLYTGLTRARASLLLNARAEIIDYALSHRVQRMSGLATALTDNE